VRMVFIMVDKTKYMELYPQKLITLSRQYLLFHDTERFDHCYT
jgi:hypothetical protein